MLIEEKAFYKNEARMGDTLSQNTRRCYKI